MSHGETPAGKVDYCDYRFGRSKQRFRGPQPDLSSPYLAFVGGSEVYGKFIREPYPSLVQNELGITCANFGSPGAGPTFFLRDPVVLEACSNAKACIISVMGAVSMSNRLYTVFKRRNNRVRTISESLRALYPRLDLSEIRFAHNMLSRMKRENPDNFKLIEIELRMAWVARMRDLLDDIETARVLVWMSTRTPDEDAFDNGRNSFLTSPSFVTRDMLEEVAPMADMVVEYVAAETVADDLDDGRVFPEEYDRLAPALPGQTMHRQVADLLGDPLRNLMAAQRKTHKALF